MSVDWYDCYKVMTKIVKYLSLLNRETCSKDVMLQPVLVEQNKSNQIDALKPNSKWNIAFLSEERKVPTISICNSCMSI